MTSSLCQIVVLTEPLTDQRDYIMEVKEAVALAKKYVRDVFADEQIDNLGLEEVEFDGQRGTWSVTIGFSRPWEEASGTFGAKLAGFVPRRRDYKVVRITDADKKVTSVKNREPIGE
jgi:hypothetical protein